VNGRRQFQSTVRAQRGIALLILLILFGLTFAFIMVNAMNKSGSELALARDQKTRAALDMAKQALLTYAATSYAESAMSSISHSPNRGVPGYLPCPDMGPPGPEGQAAIGGPCGTALVSLLGKLPWNTLGIEPLRDGSGECLWYAVSGTYKVIPNGVTTNTATSNMMNWDTPGLFDVMAADGVSYLAGNSASARAVAVILAPGSAFSGQSRAGPAGLSCGGNYIATAYLETANSINNSAVSGIASAVTKFIAGQASNSFNDSLVYITRDELWTAIKKRPDFQVRLNSLTQRIAQCIAEYGKHNSAGSSDMRLPWAGRMTLTNYSVDSQYDDANSDPAGRAPYRVNTSDSATVNTIVSPYYLPTTTSYCYTLGILDDHDINWYSNWKDHLFYGVAANYRPSTGTTTAPCTSGSCLKINAGASLYAGVVIFAGERLASLNQMRDTDTDRANITNYLEGNNTSSNSSGNNSYQTGAVTSTFNDMVFCIQPALNVVGPSCP